MTRDEYLAVLASEPATPNQVGAIRAECDRLGLGGDRDRRLAVCAAVLGLDRLGSTRDLRMGLAGRLVGVLRQAESLDELEAAPARVPDPPRCGGFRDAASAAAPQAGLFADAVRLLAEITAAGGPGFGVAGPAAPEYLNWPFRSVLAGTEREAPGDRHGR